MFYSFNLRISSRGNSNKAKHRQVYPSVCRHLLQFAFRKSNNHQKESTHHQLPLTSLVVRSKFTRSLSFSRMAPRSRSISFTNSSRSCSRSAAWSSRNCRVALSCLSAASIWLRADSVALIRFTGKTRESREGAYTSDTQPHHTSQQQQQQQR